MVFIFLQFRALMGKSISMYQVVRVSDTKLQNKQSVDRCVQILGFLRLVMQVVLPKEKLCWLVYNGKVLAFNSGKHKRNLKLTLLHSERPKLHRVLALLSAIGFKLPTFCSQTWARLFKTNDVSLRDVKISNVNISNMPVFFIDKNVKSFSHFFQPKISVFWVIKS